jgi:hypothetical protein
VGVKKAINIGILGLLAFSAAGCEPLEKMVSQVVEKQVSKRDAEQKLRIKQLETNIATIENKIAFIEMMQELQSSAIDSIDTRKATISDGGTYGIAKTLQTPVFVSIEKIEPHLDGYKVALSVGNPSSVIFDGSQIEVEWGLPWGAKGRTSDEIRASRKTKKFSFPREFPPNTYTHIEVALTPATAEEVKTLQVGVNWNTIKLRGPAQPK